ncbi:MAG: orotidine-5'-phosphate decarboxylase [Spirochaetaceae bacterium]|nr:orotidine-5'-phosphate decarboxylase [Spirochaetaceae bacterium]MCF7948390.1 orotidine-5'-phosphate decarboxylase [Spirochaetia bacterium]MCF7951274.1 orotidine-5'-phosphate decarboxylase [Spirochaetaceae bacterium]
MSGVSDYIRLLESAAGQSCSIACMGIDPVAEGLPSPSHSFSSRVLEFFEPVFEQMLKEKVLPGAFKPNIGYFHVFDAPFEERFEGSLALSKVIQLIRQHFPNIPLILDMKRGDIARSSQNYAQEAFSVWKGDAVTIFPYMGSDSVGPFIEAAAENGGGVYVLNRTSNPGGRELQNIICNDSRPLYSHVADKVIEWNRAKANVGAVVGATSPEELKELAALYGSHSVPLLIPGVGGQGGSAQQTVKLLKESGYPLALARVNSSSSLTHPWVKKKSPLPKDWPVQVVENLRILNQELAYEQ